MATEKTAEASAHFGGYHENEAGDSPASLSRTHSVVGRAGANARFRENRPKRAFNSK
jgi:hypothetical protein